MKKIFLFILLSLVFTLSWADNVVNIYNWSGYIPPEVLALFQKETGIRINYSTFEDNQILYTKLKADPNGDYDVAVPTSYIVQRMYQEGMLLKLDKSKIPNFKNLNPKLLNQFYDPGNQYSIPYLWGTTGILLNSKYYPKGTVTKWSDLWEPRFRNKISLSNNMRDMFAVAMHVLGYSINDRNPEHIKQAYLKLKELLPNAISFESGGSQPVFVNEDVNVGVVNSGDARMIRQDNPNFYYVYPQEGVLVWIDSMVIPKNAKHVENAYKFINFVLRPDVAKMISEGVGYSSPNLAAIKLMSAKDQQDHILNPSKKDLQNAETEENIGVPMERFCLKYWELLKLGG